jgi:hypothetical protein
VCVCGGWGGGGYLLGLVGSLADIIGKDLISEKLLPSAHASEGLQKVIITLPLSSSRRNLVKILKSITRKILRYILRGEGPSRIQDETLYSRTLINRTAGQP